MPKILKIGNSAGVTLNRQVLDFLGWLEGDEIIIEQGENESEIKLINIRIESKNFNKKEPKVPEK